MFDKANDASNVTSLRFFTPCAALRPYLSSVYRLTTRTEPGEEIADLLHPEWANLRFFCGQPPVAAIGRDDRRETARATIIGPTSHATYFACRTMRAWGIGLLPAGWQKFIAAPAQAYADRLAAIDADPALSGFAPLADLLACEDRDEDATFAAIEAHLRSLLASAPSDDALLWRAHAALVDDSVATVAEWSDRIAISPRTLERLSRRSFGFAPKLLLRRQRFLRSLAQFMLDPTMRWTHTLDHRYGDQPQFTRDFARFMGMSAGAYALRPHPILEAAAAARMVHAGAAMQVLHAPEAPAR